MGEFTGTELSLVAGRNGKGCKSRAPLRRPSTHDPTPPTAIVVVGWLQGRLDGGTSITSVRTLFEFRSDNGALLHGRVTVDIGGSLYATDGRVNKGGSAVGTIVPNVWHYAEVRYRHDDTVGEFALRPRRCRCHRRLRHRHGRRHRPS